MAGLTPNGLEIRTQPELQELLETAVREALPGIDLSEGPEAQLIGILSEELAIVWEALQAVYAAAYPDSASGILLDMVAALTGTTRRAATPSRVTVTLTLEDGATVPAGSIIAVESDPDAQFETTEAVSNSTGATDTFDVVCESLETGPVAAPAGTLTVIVTPVAGWTAASNLSDAELGEEEANDDELREQRLVELAAMGHGTYAAIRAVVARVEGVQEVAVYGNETSSVDADGRPAKSFEVVLWDGDPAAADDDAIAQAIHDTKPAGIEAHGSTSGTATDEDGADVTVEFTRAAKLRVYVDAQVVLEPGTGGAWATDAADAVASRAYAVGDTAYASQLICALLEVPGIVAVTSLTLGTSSGPVGSSVAADYDEIVQIASADVNVTEAP